MRTLRRQAALCLLYAACLGSHLPAAAQPSAPALRHANPTAVGEGAALRIDLSAELYNIDFARSKKEAALDITIPIAMGRNRQSKSLMYVGLTTGNTYFNVENRFTAMARYGLRFDLSNRNRELYLTTALGAGVDYDHIDIGRLLEGGSDPFLNDLSPNSVRFAGQAGVSVHNDRFSVGVFTPRFAQRVAETEIGLSAGYASDRSRKVAIRLCGYGTYAKAGDNAGFYGRVSASIFLARFIGLDLDYDSRNRMHIGASLHIKEKMSVLYSCGFSAFRFKTDGVPFISHYIGLSFSFSKNKEKE